MPAWFNSFAVTFSGGRPPTKPNRFATTMTALIRSVASVPDAAPRTSRFIWWFQPRRLAPAPIEAAAAEQQEDQQDDDDESQHCLTLGVRIDHDTNVIMALYDSVTIKSSPK